METERNANNPQQVCGVWPTMENEQYVDNPQQVCGVWLPAADTHFRQSLRETGTYLIERLRAALSYCPVRRVAIDVGAHVGIWTCEMIAQFDEVYAFEPAPDSFACLLRNVDYARSRPGSARTVHLRNLAVGKEIGRGSLLADPLPKRQGNTGARYVDADHAGPVSVLPLDDLGLKTCDFLKIDVEGAELNVLTGAAGTISRCEPVVMVEIGKTPPERFGHTPARVHEFLGQLGLKMILEMRGDKVYTWPVR